MKNSDDDRPLYKARVRVTGISPLTVDLKGSGGSLAMNPVGWTFTVGDYALALHDGSSKPLVFPIR